MSVVAVFRMERALMLLAVGVAIVLVDLIRGGDVPARDCADEAALESFFVLDVLANLVKSTHDYSRNDPYHTYFPF